MYSHSACLLRICFVFNEVQKELMVAEWLVTLTLATQDPIGWWIKSERTKKAVQKISSTHTKELLVIYLTNTKYFKDMLEMKVFTIISYTECYSSLL